jgi:hypothetical protein
MDKTILLITAGIITEIIVIVVFLKTFLNNSPYAVLSKLGA